MYSRKPWVLESSYVVKEYEQGVWELHPLAPGEMELKPGDPHTVLRSFRAYSEVGASTWALIWLRMVSRGERPDGADLFQSERATVVRCDDLPRLYRFLVLEDQDGCRHYFAVTPEPRPISILGCGSDEDALDQAQQIAVGQQV